MWVTVGPWTGCNLLFLPSPTPLLPLLLPLFPPLPDCKIKQWTWTVCTLILFQIEFYNSIRIFTSEYQIFQKLEQWNMTDWNAPKLFCFVNIRSGVCSQTPCLEGLPFRVNLEVSFWCNSPLKMSIVSVFGDSTGCKSLLPLGPVWKEGIKWNGTQAGQWEFGAM